MKFVKLLILASALMFSFNSAIAQLEWVKFDGTLPDHTVIGGVETHRSLPICRCNFKGAMHPGKVVDNRCNIGYGGLEKMVRSFEVLVNNGGVELEWLKVKNSLPDHAIEAGKERGVPLYVGRAYHEKGTHPGKIFKAGGNYICNIGYGGKEITYTTFEVLVESHHPEKFAPDARCTDSGSLTVVRNIKTLGKETQVDEGMSVASRNLEYQARVTDDGRLVIERIVHHMICDNGTIVILEANEIWSNTKNKGDASKNYFLKFQDDGNLCIYSKEDGFVWCSMSNGQDGHHFEITNMGHIEVVNNHGVEIWPD